MPQEIFKLSLDGINVDINAVTLGQRNRLDVRYSNIAGSQRERIGQISHIISAAIEAGGHKIQFADFTHPSCHKFEISVTSTVMQKEVLPAVRHAVRQFASGIKKNGFLESYNEMSVHLLDVKEKQAGQSPKVHVSSSDPVLICR